METIFLSFQAIFPLLAYMALGYFLRTRTFFTGRTVKEMNNLVFRVLLPLSIFQSIYTADLRQSFRLDVTIFVAAASIALYLVLSLLIPRLEKQETSIPVMVQGIHKSNYNLLAIPIVSSFVGSELGMTAVLVAIITPIVNTCAVLSFETHRETKTAALPLLKKVLLNPMVLSSLLGVAANLLNIPIPSLVMNGVIKKLAAMATPLALIALGSDFDFSGLRRYAKQLTVVTVGKLVLTPAVIVPAAVVCGIRGADLLAVTVFSGAPTAVNSYSTAVSLCGNEELAGQIVVLTSVCSLLTMFLWFCILGWTGLI